MVRNGLERDGLAIGKGGPLHTGEECAPQEGAMRRYNGPLV